MGSDHDHAAAHSGGNLDLQPIDEEKILSKQPTYSFSTAQQARHVLAIEDDLCV